MVLSWATKMVPMMVRMKDDLMAAKKAQEMEIVKVEKKGDYSDPC